MLAEVVLSRTADVHKNLQAFYRALGEVKLSSFLVRQNIMPENFKEELIELDPLDFSNSLDRAFKVLETRRPRADYLFQKIDITFRLSAPPVRPIAQESLNERFFLESIIGIEYSLSRPERPKKPDPVIDTGTLHIYLPEKEFYLVTRDAWRSSSRLQIAKQAKQMTKKLAAESFEVSRGDFKGIYFSDPYLFACRITAKNRYLRPVMRYDDRFRAVSNEKIILEELKKRIPRNEFMADLRKMFDKVVESDSGGACAIISGKNKGARRLGFHLTPIYYRMKLRRLQFELPFDSIDEAFLYHAMYSHKPISYYKLLSRRTLAKLRGIGKNAGLEEAAIEQLKSPPLTNKERMRLMGESKNKTTRLFIEALKPNEKKDLGLTQS